MTTNHRRKTKNEVVVPRTSRKVVHACRYDQWHAHFKKWTFESVTIAPLSDGDVTFLLRDEVRVMEKNKGAMPERTKRDAFDRLAAETAFDEDDELMDSEARPNDDDDDDDDDDEGRRRKFSSSPSESLLTAITESIQQLGGSVHPKLTWSAPTDAIWLTQFSTKCLNCDEVMLLLQSSDRVAHDLDGSAYACCREDEEEDEEIEKHSHSLTLRKHSMSLDLSREFRVFVVNGTITGISQRDVSSFYPFLASEKSKIGWTIERFWKEEVWPSVWHKKICSDGSLASMEKNKGKPSLNNGYCMDLVLSSDNEKVRFIVDFNPFGGATLPLLFSYDELSNDDGNEIEYEVRVIETQGKVLPSKGFGVPFDLVDTSENSAIAEFIKKQQQQQQQK